MMQALGLLAGPGPEGDSDYGYLFIAFRPDLFGPEDVFDRRVTELIERIKATPRQPGIEEIRIPSERAFRARERLLREGLRSTGWCSTARRPARATASKSHVAQR